MLGYAHAAGFRKGPRTAVTIASYFSMPEATLARALATIETSEHAEILLLQNPDPTAKVSASVFFPSVWSKVYARFGSPYGRPHRDFHYQVMFCALAYLVEVGCLRLRIDHPKPDDFWSHDAYTCLTEVHRNICLHMNGKVTVGIVEETCPPNIVKAQGASVSSIHLEQHRAIGISPYVSEGLNMRRIFIESAKQQSSWSKSPKH